MSIPRDMVAKPIGHIRYAGCRYPRTVGLRLDAKSSTFPSTNTRFYLFVLRSRRDSINGFGRHRPRFLPSLFAPDGEEDDEEEECSGGGDSLLDIGCLRG